MFAQIVDRLWKCCIVFCFVWTLPLCATWSVPENLSATGQDAEIPQIAVDAAGNATAVWERSNGTNTIIQASTKPIGGSWQATPDDLSATGQNANFPQIAVDPNGNATAIWARFDGANTIIQAATKPFGGSWQAPENLSAIGQNASKPQISVDPNGNAIAIWKRSNGTNDIIQAATKPFGGSWQTPEDLSATGQNADNPQISIDPNGNATAVWERSDGANTIIQAATKLFGGSWQTPEDLSAVGQDATTPQIAVDSNGNATAIWTRDNGLIFIVQTSTKPFGGSWQAVPDDISAAGFDTFDPQIATDANGNLTAVWTAVSGGNEYIQASTKPFGGSWQAVPDDISMTTNLVDFPQIAVDPNGNATVVWEEFLSGNLIIRASEQLIFPQVLDVSPNTGPPSGGTIVTLTGIGFITATDVSFGATSASFIINSDSSITVTAPPGALGTINVIVTTTVGSSIASTSNEFTYANLQPPQNLKGKQKTNRFLTQEDLINVITWKTPSGPAVTTYKIYRDASLTDFITTVKILGFQDHNRKKNTIYTYYVISEDEFGNTSPTINSIAVYPD